VDLVNTAVAAPVRGSDGAVIASLSIAFPHGEADVQGMTHLVRLTATSVSRALAAAGYGDSIS
jgi:DNA-binding IclR family transcriptional regulator